MYDGMKVYGPYTRKDGRQHVVLKTPGKKDWKTISYPKYIVELNLNRKLDIDETIDHIDGNFLNNNLNNLRVVPRSIHAKSHTAVRVFQDRICPICGKRFNTNLHWRKTCGDKRCAGKTAHLLGYNKGNNLAGVKGIKKSLRSLAENYNAVR